MKEFNEWWMKNSYKVPLKCSFDLYPEFQECWRAALEWMLSQERSICYSIPVVPTDIIRKELEDED